MQDYLTYKQIYFKRHHVIKLRTTRNVTKKVIKKKWLSKKTAYLFPYTLHYSYFHIKVLLTFPKTVHIYLSCVLYEDEAMIEAATV